LTTGDPRDVDMWDKDKNPNSVWINKIWDRINYILYERGQSNGKNIKQNE
jgi:hypothetical protein